MAAAKRIIICCDGTWNEPDDIPTNVTKMVRAISPVSPDGIHQVVFYDQGVGTGGKIDKFIGGAFGSGLEKNVLDCYRFLIHNYQLGDEIYAFGFSRGAYTARAFVGLIHAVGLLEKSTLDKLTQAYKHYRTEPEERQQGLYEDNYRPDIRMVGVFDTVGALGAPTPLLGKFTRNWVGFFNTRICAQVKYAYHALALDEKRAPFQPDMWTGTLQDDQYMEQCWFAGAHSDIGGGYAECGLSDIALQWMVGKASALGLVFNQTYLDAQCKPDLNMQPHDSYSFSYKLLEKMATAESVRLVFGDPANPPINVSIHDSVYQRVAKGNYQPQNPDFPAADKLADRRNAVRFQVNDTPQAQLTLKEFAASCKVLDFSKGGGARIQFDGELKTGDSVSIDSERFGHNIAQCVWQKGNQYGLQFAA
ncbi:DUF2235 domain-containing protein [Rheinheimera baltica]|uniref:DUF2235 domain-containing protein n=1 Tax=Rheinheimera baltica TaxID=67576 RepID=UPI00273D0E1B|nr:DUF2235 domain-containing protein [Rheinheimera baltica]MDP5189623.1 DUF2235 domain-containing protein [Rheinheimera baltica]